MHGQQQWQQAEGMIVDVQPAHGRHEHNFAVEVRKGDGRLIRRTVKHKEQTPYAVGTRVRIEISDDNQIRFDANYPGDAAILSVMDMTDQIQEAAAAFDRPGARGPNFGSLDGLGAGAGGGPVIMTGAGSGMAAGAGISALLGALGSFGGAGTHVIGPDGQEIALDPAELGQLTQAMMSGDPAAKEAARQRLHQLRDQAMAQAGAGSPAQSGTVHHGTPEQRLEALQRLHDKGLLSEHEYQAQRQQIISGI